MPVKHFEGSQVRAIREDAGLSREQVAVAVRRSWNWLYQVERGELTPRADLLAALASLLECQIDDFYVEDGEHG